MNENTIAIKILGDDEDCAQIEEIVRAMLEYMSLAGEIEKVQAAGAAGVGHVTAYPALFIGEKIVCRGPIPKAAEVSTWLADAVTRG